MDLTGSASRTALYRLFDQEGRLLYVGISVNPTSRWSVHAGEKTWWPEVHRKDVEWFGDRQQAEAAEIAAIAKERPLYNVEHSTVRKRGDAKSEYRSPYPAPRQIRVATEMWLAFDKAAKANGTTRGRLLLQFVRWYVRRPGVKLPKRPPGGPWSADPS
ncbi:GIY-YIG nuclease family protein [Streptomyces harbinensis]|uniref:GIY-YIG nuclease family protein n=1 Tax=Streptomyces harbinensis TaxID=1176198 RepID=UPI00367C3460